VLTKLDHTQILRIEYLVLNWISGLSA